MPQEFYTVRWLEWLVKQMSHVLLKILRTYIRTEYLSTIPGVPYGSMLKWISKYLYPYLCTYDFFHCPNEMYYKPN